MDFFSKLLGNPSQNAIKKIMPKVTDINKLEPQLQALSDEELRGKTNEFKKRLEAGEALNDILCEAFAVVREAAVRSVGMRPFDVQLVGGIVLHQGRIAEMKTGEGKTLAATLPAYLNALTGKGVHIVTVNDYLAKRDSEWMGKIYRFLGLSVGLIVHGLSSEERKIAYDSDITYGTNNEFGFDYLRDNMVVYKEQLVQRELNYAIVDEVDSILIDEARTPLIISGHGEESTDLYVRADQFVQRLKVEDDYTIDEKLKTIMLTEQGVSKAEQYFNVENLSDLENTELNHHIQQAVKAHALMKRDVDYVVQNGEVIIVDEFTGRLMLGRRYNQGLHQAIEAKEHVEVAHENKTLATITFQNYFRMYKKLSGMTGTAKTEEEEFQGIYSLDVVEIPTNKPMIRDDQNDCVYVTEKGKFLAVIDDIVELHKKGTPILVGTISVEKSETLSQLLSRRGIKHQVLNAKFHEKEALIVAQAGKFGAVTIATNMAGRGTDILLGGNPDFLARSEMKRQTFEDSIIEEATGHAETKDEEILTARKKYDELFNQYKKETDVEHEKVVGVGGLHIIGTERHESRRIDNQLRGRSGRQGDPGSSRFYVSLEDDLMRLFGSDRIKDFIGKMNPEDNVPIENRLISKQIESAQKKVESRNFDTRKHVLQYDDVMNQQRGVIYSQRRMVLEGENMSSLIMDMLKSVVEGIVDLHISNEVKPEDWDLDALQESFRKVFLPKGQYIYKELEKEGLAREEVIDKAHEFAKKMYGIKEARIMEKGADMREVERIVLLRVVDEKWMDHIDAMDELRRGIGLRAYGQNNPIVEYQREGYEMFEDMVKTIQEDTISALYRVNVESRMERKQVAKPTEASQGDQAPRSPQRRKNPKIGPNAPCPCGSGKKYKQCCGRQ